MFNPKFQVLINKESFYSDEIIGLGTQVITIVEFLQKILKPHIWYGADISAFNTTVGNLDFHSFLLKEIGNDLAFIQICKQINQFLSGVFFAINIQESKQEIQNIEVSTEDKQFRSLRINGVLIEIRAFDTSFFSLYSEDENIIEELAKRFQAKIIKCPND